MQMPDGATPPRHADSTLIRALARAFRWKRKLESGEIATIAELAEGKGIAASYITRVLRVTLLAPEIVEVILDGRQGPGGDAGVDAGAVSGMLDGADHSAWSSDTNGPKRSSEGEKSR
jgi:hypothetical protein